MADISEKYGTLTSLTITNANLASSATAGWQSAVVDNTTDLFDDIEVHVDLAAVNTAPANSKAIFFFLFGLTDDAASNYETTGDGAPGGTEGTLTYPDITANPIVARQLGIIPYPVQNKSLKKVFLFSDVIGAVPPKWALGMLNHSGMTLSVNSIKYRGIKYTVA
jgi:hypothetical protein